MRLSSPNGWDFWTLGELEFESGQHAEALKDWSTAARTYGWNEEVSAWERAYAGGGSRALIAEVVKVADAAAKERYFSRDILIDAHRYAGDRDGTLAWLAIASKEHNPLVRHLRSDRRWDSYRSDPRFQAIARQEVAYHSQPARALRPTLTLLAGATSYLPPSAYIDANQFTIVTWGSALDVGALDVGRSQQ